MANSKMTTCKVCGAEIAKNAKVCPNCGAKNKKPIYQRPWFIILCVLVLFSMLGTCGGNNNTNSGSSTSNTQSTSTNTNTNTEKTSDVEKTPEPTPEPVEYQIVSVDQMMDELKNNALKAQETYKGQYIEITGKLNNIDASGKYISIASQNEPYAISGVQCYVKTDEQRGQVAQMNVGDSVTLRGRCKDVGEIIGYQLDIDSIDGYEPTEQAEVETVDGYIVCTATELVDDLQANALAAKQKYEGNMLSVTGKLSNIDSNGKYIDISPVDNPYSFTIIQCYIKSDDVKAAVMELNSDDVITVNGKCTSVGEVMGYSINIESIE